MNKVPNGLKNGENLHGKVLNCLLKDFLLFYLDPILLDLHHI